MKHILVVLLFLSAAHPALAQESNTVKTEILSKNSTSWDGTKLPSLPSDSVEITIARITIPPGVKLPVHKHPNPLGGYVISGTLTVMKDDGTSRSFKAGESVVELVNTWHNGMNNGDEPLVLIAFYIGKTGIPLTILKETQNDQ